MKRFSLALLVTAMAASACLVAAAPVSAKTPCYSRVINDWYVDGRIDGTYPIACYRKALAKLPEDIRQYADANDVISRAMTLAIRNGKGGPPSPRTGPGTKTSTNTHTTVPSSDRNSPTGPPSAHPDPIIKKALERLGPSNANSIPLPLIILGALALLLLAAGAAGMVARKLQERRMPVTPVGSPPPDVPPAT